GAGPRGRGAVRSRGWRRRCCRGYCSSAVSGASYPSLSGMDSGESSDILPAHRHVTPVELNQTTFGRAVRGYDPEEVDALLAKVRESYSELYKERLELAVEVRTLQDEINRLDADQNLIREVLVEAKRTADELRA